MFKHVDDWNALVGRLAHPLDFMFQLVKGDDLLLFMPYVVKHERTEIICKLIRPSEVGIDHIWDQQFIDTNSEKIKQATDQGRIKTKGNTEVAARIFTAIAEFENANSPYDIQNYNRPYKDIKSQGAGSDGFEWDGLDDTYPVALLAKTDAGDAGQLCSLVITLVFKSSNTSNPKNRDVLEIYLESLAKHKINVVKVSKLLGDLDAEEWNAFRSCFHKEEMFEEFNFHHLTHGGDAHSWLWDDGKKHLKEEIKNLLINASYPLDTGCICHKAENEEEKSNQSCIDVVLGYPSDKPSVRELLQWDHKGQSLTRALLLSTPHNIAALGDVQHNYCWCNPFCIHELIKKIGASEIHADECAANILNSGKLQNAYIYEEISPNRNGLWLCAHIPGFLTPRTWPEISGNHPFGQIIKLARKSGARDVYRIDSDSQANRKIWKINENEDCWANEVTELEDEFGDVVKHILPQSGLVIFIPARITLDGRNCWEVNV